jgi:hypothetical protein
MHGNIAAKWWIPQMNRRRPAAVRGLGGIGQPVGIGDRALTFRLCHPVNLALN